jgi:hypothetical protein
VLSSTGELLFTSQDVLAGQEVFLKHHYGVFFAAPDPKRLEALYDHRPSAEPAVDSFF